jgi:hypothetical protein
MFTEHNRIVPKSKVRTQEQFRGGCHKRIQLKEYKLALVVYFVRNSSASILQILVLERMQAVQKLFDA